MNEAQKAAFTSSSGMPIDKLGLLCLSFVCAMAFIWAAWTVVTLYRGWAAGNVPLGKLMGGMVRMAFTLGILFYVVL